MIGYATIGTNDLPRASKFYDALLAQLDAKRFMEVEGYIAYAISPEAPMLLLTKPYNKEPASVGNGMMIGFQASSPEHVQAIHSKAMEMGGSCEGAPGPRSGGFYAGYFRDLDGNKLNAYCMVPQEG